MPTVTLDLPDSIAAQFKKIVRHGMPYKGKSLSINKVKEIRELAPSSMSYEPDTTTIELECTGAYQIPGNVLKAFFEGIAYGIQEADEIEYEEEMEGEVDTERFSSIAARGM